MKVEENCSLFFDSAFEARDQIEREFSKAESCNEKSAAKTVERQQSETTTINESPVKKQKEDRNLSKKIDEQSELIPPAAHAPVMILLVCFVLFLIFAVIASLKAVQTAGFEKYNLKMIKSFQFIVQLVGFVCFMSAVMSDYSTQAELMQNYKIGAVFFLCAFVVALLLNIRKSNFVFAFFYTIVQSIVTVASVICLWIFVLLFCAIIDSIKRRFFYPRAYPIDK